MHSNRFENDEKTTVLIRSLPKTVHIRLRLLGIGLNKSMADVLTILVNRAWDEYGGKIRVDSKSKRRIRSFIKKNPSAL